MSSHAIGPLVPADEALCHQIPDTFATVTTSDFAWTEKICAMAAARDGSLQLGFGLGKYINRNVMDAYAGFLAEPSKLPYEAAGDYHRNPTP